MGKNKGKGKRKFLKSELHTKPHFELLFNCAETLKNHWRMLLWPCSDCKPKSDLYPGWFLIIWTVWGFLCMYFCVVKMYKSGLNPWRITARNQFFIYLSIYLFANWTQTTVWKWFEIQLQSEQPHQIQSDRSAGVQKDLDTTEIHTATFLCCQDGQIQSSHLQKKLGKLIQIQCVCSLIIAILKQIKKDLLISQWRNGEVCIAGGLQLPVGGQHCLL